MTDTMYEVEITVSRPGQTDATAHREYRSQDAASTDKASREVMDALGRGAGDRLTKVSDGE